MDRRGGGSGFAAVTKLGSVQASIDIRSLPSPSQTDTGITLTFGDVTSNPNMVQPNIFTGQTLGQWLASAAANAKLNTGSPAIGAGTSNDAPTTDYFGTTPPSPHIIKLSNDLCLFI